MNSKSYRYNPVIYFLILLMMFLVLLIIFGCESSEIRNDYEIGFDEGYGLGYKEGCDDTKAELEDTMCYPEEIISNLLTSGEPQGVESLREVYINSWLLGEYVGDWDTMIYHKADSKCGDKVLDKLIKEENSSFISSDDELYMNDKGYKSCPICCNNY